jgi:hypothetical protein
MGVLILIVVIRKSQKRGVTSLSRVQVNTAARQAVPVTTSIQQLSDAIAAGAVAMFR